MRAVSGAMYSGVPNTTPCCVTCPSLASGSRTLATPKSRIFTKSNAFSRSRDRVQALLVGELANQLAAPFARREHDVLGLEIAVDDPLRVRRAQRARHLVDDGDRAQQIEAALARQHGVERFAVQILHHEEDGPVVRLAEVGDVDDVRVIDQARRARLAQEALDRLLAAAVPLVEDLHRDLLADVDVLAAVDDAHAAATHDLAQLVLADAWCRLGRPQGSSCSISDRASTSGRGMIPQVSMPAQPPYS